MDFYKRILRSDFVWRLAGLTWYTAVRATRGHYLSKVDYLSESTEKTSALNLPLPAKNVMEFGSGLGGNLISIAKSIKLGIGVDINPLFVHGAKRLSRKFNCNNLTFLSYDGSNFPSLPKFDLIFSVNVFERIKKDVVRDLIPKIVSLGSEDCIFVIFFLNENAKETEFTKLLGNDAYVYWSHDELLGLFSKYDMNVEISEWGMYEQNAYIVRATLLKRSNQRVGKRISISN